MVAVGDQAVGRALWLSYKITDKRVSVLSISPLRKERTDIPMDQIEDVVCVGRGIGAWGDMVVTLRNGESGASLSSRVQEVRRGDSRKDVQGKDHRF